MPGPTEAEKQIEGSCSQCPCYNYVVSVGGYRVSYCRNVLECAQGMGFELLVGDMSQVNFKLWAFMATGDEH